MASSRAGLAAAAVLLAAAALVGWHSGDPGPPTYDARVVHVVDGDTIAVALRDGRRETVRVLGVDTPETVKPGTPVQCYGPEASRYTKSRLTGRAVRLELDAETRDRYGRLLAYVLVDGRRFDDELLRLGYARLLVIAPNDAHGRALLAAENDAREHRRGLWSACPS
jgi:micrococcal nuclease